MGNMFLEVAAIQLNSQDDVGKNLEQVTEQVCLAREHGARLILLPENFAHIGAEQRKCEIAESLESPEGPIARHLSHLARQQELVIIAGGMPERSVDPARPYNTSVVFDQAGEIIARYRKLHLFKVDMDGATRVDESTSNTAGDDVVVVEVAGWRVGLSICYDLRFPELYRQMVERRAELMVVPASFTMATGKDHWSVLLRARAIENQVYVMAAGQWGTHPRGPVTYGKSMVLDPWGMVIAQCSEGVGQCRARLSRGYLERVRGQLPALEHRRL